MHHGPLQELVALDAALEVLRPEELVVPAVLLPWPGRPRGAGDGIAQFLAALQELAADRGLPRA